MKRFFHLFLTVFLFGAVTTAVMAQDLINNGHVCNNATGTIRLISPNSNFENNGTDNTSGYTYGVKNDGVFEFTNTTTGNYFTGTEPLGSDPAHRVPGTVSYAASAATTAIQKVQGAYYTHLTLSQSAAKNIEDGVYVFGTYTVAPSSGNRTYNGTFHYDGDGSLGTQIIFAENGASAGTNRYNNLDLLNNAVKKINAGDQIILDGALTHNGGMLYIQGELDLGTTAFSNAPIGLDHISAVLKTGSGLATYAGGVTVTNGTVQSDAGAGKVLIPNGATLALGNSNDAKVNFASGTELEIAGDFTNAFAAATNLLFDCNSTVIYSNTNPGQNILNTVETNPYGNLIATNANKQAAGDIFLCGALTLNNANIDMGSNTLTMLDVAQPATFVGGLEEVIGAMRRKANATYGTFITGTPYTFNNAHTQLTFTAGTFDNDDIFGFDVFPSTAPNQYDGTKDINRKITWHYTNTTNDWVATLEVAYRDAELPAGADESTVRFYEASTANVEKVSTGQPYNRTGTTATLSYVSLPGIMGTTATVDGTPDKYFASGNDVLLRTGPAIIYAIANGRWSNPASWDEGAEPTPADEVVIDGYTIHVGFTRPNVDNYGGDESYPTQLASKVTIGSDPNSALVFGPPESGYPTTYYGFPSGSQIINNNNSTAVCYNTSAADFTAFAGNSNTADGIVVFEGAIVKTSTIVNNGLISNGGVIEIGH